MGLHDFFGGYWKRNPDEDFVTPQAEDVDPQSYAACCKAGHIEGGRISHKSFAALLDHVPEEVEGVLDEVFKKDDEERYSFLQDALVGNAKEWFDLENWHLKQSEDICEIISLRVEGALALRNLDNVLKPDQERSRQQAMKKHQEESRIRLEIQANDIIPTDNLEYQGYIKSLEKDAHPDVVVEIIARLFMFFKQNEVYTCFDEVGEKAFINALDFLQKQNVNSFKHESFKALKDVVIALGDYLRMPSAKAYLDAYFDKPQFKKVLGTTVKMQPKKVAPEKDPTTPAEILNHMYSNVESFTDFLKFLTRLQNLIKSREVNALSPEAQEMLLRCLNKWIQEVISPEPTEDQWKRLPRILEDCRSVCYPSYDHDYAEMLAFVKARIPEKEKWADDMPTDYDMGFGQFGSNTFKPPKPWGQDAYEKEKPEKKINPEVEKLDGLWKQFLMDIKTADTASRKAWLFYDLMQNFNRSSCFFTAVVSVDSLLSAISTKSFNLDLKTLRQEKPEEYNDYILMGLFVIEELFEKYKGRKKDLILLRNYINNLQP